MDEITVTEAGANPSRVTEIGGPATADAGTGGAALFAILNAEERQALRATLAEAHPDTVPDLIDGETVGAILASIAPAKVAFQEAVKRANAAVSVAAGGGGRPVGVDIARLSPLAKISAGLREQ
jgi:uncharacterized protein (UPF0261 family)